MIFSFQAGAAGVTWWLAYPLTTDIYNTFLFIPEIGGSPQHPDVTRWGQFTDIKDLKKEMFDRVERKFESWLNP